MPNRTPSLFTSHTQTTRLLRLSTALPADTLLAECVRGEEGISTGYTFTITALSLDAGLSLRTLLGQPALLELLTVSGNAPRAFHGHLTEIEINGANGGLARYTLKLQPWTAFLKHSRDSRVFQNMNVFDILDAVFRPWQGRATLLPAWRFDIADPRIYPVRSLTTQYQESDLAFAERLMSEEGLFHYFEHEGDARGANLGRHRMVIADHNGAFRPNPQNIVRFTQAGAVMKEDSIDRWRRELSLRTNAIELRSANYRSCTKIQVSSATAQKLDPELVSRDAPGQYAYASRAQGERLADIHMEALETRKETYIGAGTVRTLAPGTRFSLAGHADHKQGKNGDGDLVVTHVVHLMHNNLSADMRSSVFECVGEGATSSMIATEQGGSLHAPRNGLGERPLYRNRIEAIRASVPFRAIRADEHGCLLHPRPTIRGQQTAIVVGPVDAAVHTDRDHRVKIQFHWQRGADSHPSHSRLAHPYPDGHAGAPGNDCAGTWVRVATLIAGANWGSHTVPRVGQEVLVDFLDGDIDRPVVIGALYNGKGATDAQYNKVCQGPGAATGNAPAWFPGEANGHAHPAVLSGFKSQAMGASQTGTGAYSQLVFDDSAGQARIALQRHAHAHQGTAELNLGHLRHQTDNARLAAVGFGAELKTEHSAALRSGLGLLLSADQRAGAGGSHMDSREAHEQILASGELQQALTATAHKHNAILKSKGGASPEELPAIAQMSNSAEVIGSAVNDGDANTIAYTEPQLQLSSPKGIVASTPASTVVTAGTTTGIVAGQDINFAAQGNGYYAVAAGISLFTYGKASNSQKPNQETGIKFHAASGKASVQSQFGDTRLTADKSVTVASVTKAVSVAAKTHVLMTAQGACLKIEGGNIELHAPGKVEFKASMKELCGPKSSSSVEALPKGSYKGCEQATSDASARHAGSQSL